MPSARRAGGSKRPWSSARTRYECPHDCIESCRMLLMLAHNGIKLDIAMPRLQSRSSSSSIARPLEPCSRTSTRQHHPDRSEALRPCLLQLTPPQGSAPSPTYKESRFSAGAQRGKEKGRRWTCTASASARWYFSETVFSFAVLHSFVIYVDRFFLPYRFHS
ncbi:hypothetical protein SEVIR_1G193800v4 [Setaria viridis]